MDREMQHDERYPDGRAVSRDRSKENAPPEPILERPGQHLATLRETIDRLTEDQPTMSALVERLERAGIRAVPSVQRSGRLNGMSYDFDGHRIKGSDLGRAYTALGLEKRKGVHYNPERDNPRLMEAAARAKEHPVPIQRTRQDVRDRTHRTREYDGLSVAERAALREIGRFRTVSVEDFIRIQYRGDHGAWRQDWIRLAAQKLIEQRSVVVAKHSKEHGALVKALPVVVLTKKGKDLLRCCDKEARAIRQALYAGFVKPREVAHDAAIYRLYQAEAACIEKHGGRIKRVVLDFELKKRVYSPLAKARALPASEYARKQAEVAQENGLKVVQGKIRFPDLRIEYVTAAGEASRVDLELATEHYRGDHMATKDQAGFKIYAESASFPRFGGSYGKSPASDEDHLIEIFSF
jgi:hypothetical protein